MSHSDLLRLQFRGNDGDFVKQFLFSAAYLLDLWKNLIGLALLQVKKGPRANGTVKGLIWWRAGSGQDEDRDTEFHAKADSLEEFALDEG